MGGRSGTASESRRRENRMPFNNVQQDPEAERLAFLMEELGESLQAMGKIVRHGWLSVDPMMKQQDQTTNRANLERELGNAAAAMALMVEAGDICGEWVIDAATDKLKSVRKWL